MPKETEIKDKDEKREDLDELLEKVKKLPKSKQDKFALFIQGFVTGIQVQKP